MGGGNKTILLMHFNDPDNICKEETGNFTNLNIETWSNGSCKLDTAISKFGNYSCKFTYSKITFKDKVWLQELFDSGNLTIEMWLYFSDSNFATRAGLVNDTSGDITGVNFGISSKDICAGVWSKYIIRKGAPINEWFHYAFCLKEGKGKLYLNGNAKEDWKDIQLNVSQKSPLYIGIRPNVQYYEKGSTFYLNEIRISNITRYDANFTPPESSFEVD